MGQMHGSSDEKWITYKHVHICHIMTSYIYLLQDGQDVGTNVYKIGRTTQSGDCRRLKRFYGYHKLTTPVYIVKVPTIDVVTIERNLKHVFRQRFMLTKGSEWFHGDVGIMIETINTELAQHSYKPSIVEETHEDILGVYDFGNESLDHIDTRYKHWCLVSSDIQGLVEFIKKIHFDDAAPHNHNIKKHASNSLLYVVESRNWVSKSKMQVVDSMVRHASSLLSEFLMSVLFIPEYYGYYDTMSKILCEVECNTRQTKYKLQRLVTKCLDDHFERKDKG
jgi:hypothetical protein